MLQIYPQPVTALALGRWVRRRSDCRCSCTLRQHVFASRWGNTHRTGPWAAGRSACSTRPTAITASAVVGSQQPRFDMWPGRARTGAIPQAEVVGFSLVERSAGRRWSGWAVRRTGDHTLGPRAGQGRPARPADRRRPGGPEPPAASSGDSAHRADATHRNADGAQGSQPTRTASLRDEPATQGPVRCVFAPTGCEHVLPQCAGATKSERRRTHLPRQER